MNPNIASIVGKKARSILCGSLPDRSGSLLDLGGSWLARGGRGLLLAESCFSRGKKTCNAADRSWIVPRTPLFRQHASWCWEKDEEPLQDRCLGLRRKTFFSRKKEAIAWPTYAAARIRSASRRIRKCFPRALHAFRMAMRRMSVQQTGLDTAQVRPSQHPDGLTSFAVGRRKVLF